uniref:Uncharacterized protein n=1 Tax=Aquilaria malaccensis TaxID=223753 RepID=A0A4Y6GMJ8_9ROSI|nr:hypothetical protein [Aquilaria malaccensis]
MDFDDKFCSIISLNAEFDSVVDLLLEKLFWPETLRASFKLYLGYVCLVFARQMRS